MTTFSYFAYGSNMDADLLTQRLGKADRSLLRRRRGLLSDHILAFDKLSSTNPSIGYASINRMPGRSVEGILNDVQGSDLQRLDEIELVPDHYLRRTVRVLDVASGEMIEAFAYVGNASRLVQGLVPEATYLARLLRGSDILTGEYVRELSTFATAANR